MVAYANVNIGTAGTYGGPATQWVGTNGLVTCLGVFMMVNGQGVFAGHGSCQVQVPGPGPEFDAVAAAFSDLLTGAVGAFDPNVHTNIQLFSGGTDPAMSALRAGVAQWCGAAPPFTGWDSFRVKLDGTGLTYVRSSDAGTPVNGPFPFDVPVPLEPGPAIPPDNLMQ
jgi:hypothetical protein